MTLEAIRYRAGSLQILNQLLLPHETVFDEIRSVQDGYEAIKTMKARNKITFLPLSPVCLLLALYLEGFSPSACCMWSYVLLLNGVLTVCGCHQVGFLIKGAWSFVLMLRPLTFRFGDWLHSLACVCCPSTCRRGPGLFLFWIASAAPTNITPHNSIHSDTWIRGPPSVE